MKLHNIHSIRKKAYKITTNSKHSYAVSPNLLQRNFTANKPNQKWVGDITYIPTDEGWPYTAIVKDLCLKKIVGYAFSSRIDTNLTVSALEMAVNRQKPQTNLIFHSDRGVQYASLGYREALAKHSITQSMSGKGDKYHDIRQVIWAFERVRKTIQKKYGKENRLLFKRSKRLLTMRKAKPSPEQLEQVGYLLYLSDDLISAYFLKEKFYDMIDCKDRNQAEKLMYQWILLAQASRLTDHNKCADTLQNWAKPIFDTFRYPFTNGFTEGCNNKIKVLKRNAYGYRNFARFRNRILHIFYHKHFAIEKVAA